MGADIKLPKQPKQAEAAALKSSQRWVQRALQGGLVLSGVLMAAGLALHLATGQVQVLAVPLFALNGFSLADRLLAGGVLILALTPVVRVFTLLVLWWRQKDWKFALVAALVLATLAVSVLLGRGHG